MSLTQPSTAMRILLNLFQDLKKPLQVQLWILTLSRVEQLEIDD